MRKVLFSLLLIATIGVISGGVGYYLLFKADAVVAPGSLYLSHDTSYEQFEQQSVAHQIRYRQLFRLYARHIALERTLKPGHYRIEAGMSVVEIARMLKLGLQTPVRVTFHNIRTPRQLAAKLATQLEADSIALLQALVDPVATRTNSDSLSHFWHCIPDTYEFYWTIRPEQFVERMEREYDRFWSDERERLRQRTGLSRNEVVTLASIVCEESRATDEMPRIAGVYINRLRKQWPLQADPTIKYALQDFGLRRILNKHLKYESPYNTYLHRGLPPTPICLPSRSAIDAVLHYESHDYMFFCARPTFDGHHNFARDLREHNANAKAYAQALNQLKIR